MPPKKKISSPKKKPGKASAKEKTAGAKRSASMDSQPKNRTQRLESLLEIARTLNSTLSLDEVLKRSMAVAEDFVQAERSSIWEVDEDTGELFFRFIRLDKGESNDVKQIRLKPGEGIVGWVAQNNKPLVVNDVSRDERWSSAVDDKSEFKTHSILSIPLSIKGRLVGAIQLLNKKEEGRFTEEDLRDAQALANLIAIAIDNAKLYEALKKGFIGTTTALALAIDKRDKYTGGHTRRVLSYSLAIGKEMKLCAEDMENLRLSAVLHDIGKIGVPDGILNKPSRLTDEEFEVMKSHPQIGYDIMSRIPFLRRILDGMLYHHERPDGRGYPKGLKDGEIPLQAAIVSVADTFDAITTTRPYHDGEGIVAAVKELRRCVGTQFDSTVVEAFVRAVDKGNVTIERTKPKIHDPKAKA